MRNVAEVLCICVFMLGCMGNDVRGMKADREFGGKINNLTSTVVVRKYLSKEELTTVLESLSECSYEVLNNRRANWDLITFVYPFSVYPFSLLLSKHWPTVIYYCLSDSYILGLFKNTVPMLPFLVEKTCGNAEKDLLRQLNSLDLSTDEELESLLDDSLGCIFQKVGNLFEAVMDKEIKSSIFGCLEEHFG